MTITTRMAASFLAVVTALSFAASGAAAQAPAVLGVGDSVKVTVFQNPDLTTEARISEAGTINMPLIGDVAVSGLTPDNAAARIAERLTRGKFVINPQVSLSLETLRSRQVTVLGEVGHPGRYPLDDVSNSVTDLLARAGGITAEGDDNVVVVRHVNGRELRIPVDLAEMSRTGNTSRDMRLENGDVVYVNRAPQFYLYGEVQRAGAYRLQPQMTVMQAISVGGGLTPRGTLRGLAIQRRKSDGRVDTARVRPNDLVRADDVIVVRERLF
jgi:polysaccharide export outer membrane protein